MMDDDARWLADFKRKDLPEITEGLPDDWIATCGVCLGDFSVRHADSPENPSKSGTFCPDCRNNRLIAPGVLNWTRRSK